MSKLQPTTPEERHRIRTQFIVLKTYERFPENAAKLQALMRDNFLCLIADIERLEADKRYLGDLNITAVEVLHKAAPEWRGSLINGILLLEKERDEFRDEAKRYRKALEMLSSRQCGSRCTEKDDEGKPRYSDVSVRCGVCVAKAVLSGATE